MTRNLARRPKGPAPVALIAAALVLLVAATAGLYLGDKFGSREAIESEVNEDSMSGLALKAGSKFPNVELIDTLYESVSTNELLQPNGTVILFTDNDCEPCSAVSDYWQKMISDGVLENKQVVGITFDDAGSVRRYLEDNRPNYVIYSDEAFRFINEFGVSAFPLILILDGSGTIRYRTDDARVELSPRQINDYLAD